MSNNTQTPVSVERTEEGSLVKFGFNRTLSRMLHTAVPGVEYSASEEGWVVPLAGEAKLDATVAKMNAELVADQKDRAEIEKLAKASALGAMVANGSSSEAVARISDYIQKEKNIVGEMLNVNGRYAAQLTGFGADDGAAFVTIHRIDELDNAVFKGESYAIRYGSDGKAKVQPFQRAAERLDESLGKNVDGVTVRKEGDKYLVEFDYLPALSNRIRRVASSEMDKETKVWSVDADKKDFLARAVSDMRREYVEDRKDRETIEQASREAIDNANIRDAFTKDGTKHKGTVIATNDRFVAQHTGREYVAIHRASALDREVQKGDSVTVEYKERKGIVHPPKEKGRSLER